MKNWIERYLYQIEKKLPQKNKKDLIEEIKSNLYDELEATYGSIDPSEEEIFSFLQDNGSPSKIASAYRGSDDALIGKELFPIYQLVVKIALLASLLGIFIATIVAVGFENQTFLSALGSFFGGIIQATIGAVGSVTIIFAFIQRFMDPAETKLQDEFNDWNPKGLPALPEKKHQLKRSEPIVAIIFLTLLIIGFNFFSGSFVFGYYTNTESLVIPVLNQEVFLQYLPWLNLVWGSSLIFHMILLVKNQWSTLLRLIKIGLDWAGLILFLWIVSNPALFAFQGGWFQRIGLDNGAELDTLFHSMIRIGLIALIALMIFETGKNLYKIFQK